MKILPYFHQGGLALREKQKLIRASLGILCLFFLMTFGFTSAWAQVSITGTPSADPVNVGGNISLDIDVDAGTTDINTVAISLTFDPSVFQITGNTPGSTLPNSATGVVIDNTNGTITYDAAILGAGASVNGSFNLISFDVDAVGGSGLSTFAFVLGASNTEVFLAGNAINFTATDIDITVNNPNPPFQLCIASGSAGLTAFGRTFEADDPPGSPHPNRSGGTKFVSNATIAGTNTPDEETLFKAEIYGGKNNANIVNYNIPVTNGLYAVDLYFAEVYWTVPNGRVFDVFLEGNLILDEYDLVDPEKDGLSTGQTAITRTYYVDVTDGSLDVVVGPATIDNGKISGLCITEVSSANLMPTINIGALNTEALLAANLALNISDPENDNLSVTLFGLPASLSYNSGTGQIEGTPTALEAGTYTINAIISDGTSSPITEEFILTVDPPANDTPPTISAISDVEINAGDDVNVAFTVTDDNNPAATIEIFDLSQGGTAGTPDPTGPITGYTFTDNGGGSYSLAWTTTTTDGRSYLARVTASDGVNPDVIEEFKIDVAQTISDINPTTIKANTFHNPAPWFGNGPVPPYTVSIETAGNIGWADNGEFVEYLINVPTPGTYDIEFKSSNGSGTPTDINIFEEGNNTVLGSITVPSNGWGNYGPPYFTTTVTLANSGLQSLRLEFTGGVNTDEFIFTPNLGGNNAPSVSISSPLDGANFFTGDNIAFTGSATDIEDDDATLTAAIDWNSDIDGNIGTGGTFNTSSLSSGTHTITASVTDLDPSNPLQGSAVITINVIDPAPACNVSFRVNAGGPQYNDPTGNFLEDQTVASPGGTAGVGTPSQYYDASLVDNTFGSTAPLASNSTGYPDILFQTERWSGAANPNNMKWTFPVAAGVYDVKILFNENWSGEVTNPRVFDVEIEGIIALDDYRPSGPTGADFNIAKVETYQVTVLDGDLNINFIKGTQNPAVKGFDICYVGPVNNTPPVVTITSPANGVSVNRGANVSFSGTAIDTEDGDISTNLNWSTDDPQVTLTPTSGIGANVDIQFVRPGVTTIDADVTDSGSLTGNDAITVTVSDPLVSITSPTAASTVNGPLVTLNWSATDVLYGNTEHFHIYVNPLDPNNPDPNTRISTASAIGQTTWDLDVSDGIVAGSNTIVIYVADQFHTQFANAGATDIVTFSVVDNTPPVISLNGPDPQNLIEGSTYSELGATAQDDFDGDISGSIAIDVSAVNMGVAGSYPVTYNVSDAAGNAAATVTRTVNVIELELPGACTNTLYRVNVGGPVLAAADASAVDWSIDQGNFGVGTNVSPFLVANTTGGSTYSGSSGSAHPGPIIMTDPSVPASASADIFNTERYDLASSPEMQWEFAITPGTEVQVTLLFAELFGSITGPNQRVFDVSIEGTVYPAFDDIDPYAIAGPKGAFTRSVTLVVNDGTLDIDFIHGIENPALKGIQICDVSDLTLPVITLIGAGTLNLTTADSYTELGATANDNVDGDISGNIVIDASAVDMNTPGSYSVTYNVSDAAGNAALQVVRTVNVTDGTAPVITLIGAGTLNLTTADSYTELGATANDNVDGDISGNIVIDASAVDINTPGSYSVTYNVSDAAGNAALQVVRTVNVTDGTAPVITLIGAGTLNLTTADSYIELGATANDNVDGDISGNIVIDASAVDINTPGSYSVTYNVSDAAGNAALQVVRTVNVTDGTAPVITLIGAGTLNLTTADSYTELGATANDNVDGDISGNIVIDASAVNTSVAGSYSVTYNVSDAAGNAATQVVRTVIVSDASAPVISLLGANPVLLNVGDPYNEPGAIANDDVDGDISANIVIDATAVDINIPGSYSVTYNVSDAAGNAAIQVVRAVVVSDVTAPVITLLGTNPVNLNVGDPYNESGAVANDDVDGDISANIVIDALAVDINNPGSYSVTYNVSDAAGNAALQVVRTVNVTDGTAPVITLIGAGTLNLTTADSYTELGATANDNVDGDISGNIVIDASAVDINTPGSYSVTYNVSDAAGNAALQVVRTVNVTDGTAPVITLIGAGTLNLTTADSYTELGATANDNVDGDISGNIVIDASAVDINTPGSYSVTYNVSDAAGNAALQVVRTVNVTDGTAPVITLIGAGTLNLTTADSYTELGATANDNVDGDISGNIVIDASAVDINTPGSYSVTYNVSDAAGNAALQVVRTVNVTDGTAPVISLLGADPLNLTVGDSYSEPGATASDNVDGDISGNIVIDASAVNTSLAGSYSVTYNVSDAAGNAATQVVRTVIVNAAPIYDVFFNINPALSNVNENDVFTVNVEVEANAQQIDLAEIHLSFDPSVVQVQNLTNLVSALLDQELIAPTFDNVAGTIDFAASKLTPVFPSGNFNLLAIEFVAIGGPTTQLDFTFGLPSTIATFAIQNVLTGTTGATINVTENPELVISPNVFNEALIAGNSTTNSFVVSTSDAGTLPALTLTDDANAPDWLVVNPTNDGYSIDASGLTAGNYTATITASGAGYDDGFATVNLVVSQPGIPTALVEITPGGNLNASTYGGADKLIVTNQSTGGIQITGVSIDLSTGLLPDMVFDPTGSGGDATAQCFTPGANATLVGLIPPFDPCVDPFSFPRQGGFDVLSLGFNQFDPSESFGWIVDIDPNSIQGVAGAGNAGAVSGYELIGATITVNFSDGSTLTGNLYEEGTLGGANALIAPAPTVAPSISVIGVPTTPATVGNLNQTFTISGTPGDNVSLLQMDSRTYIASGDPPFNVADPTYYANEAMSGKTLYTATIGTGGTVDIPVVLLQTIGAPAGTPDGGLNHFIAVSHTGSYGTAIQTSATSNPIILLYDQSSTLDGNLNIPNLCQGETVTVKAYLPGTNTLVYTGTAPYANGFIMPGFPVGTFDLYLKVDGYLQRLRANKTFTVGGTTTVGFASILAGDVDGDNDVDLNDFTLFSAAFSSSIGDINFNPSADFDCNGIINIQDFTLLSPQFNTLGEQP